MTVRTRFAPSPTGYLHVGGARTALFSWLHARKHGGVFVLRVEDTDRERSTAESVNAILEGMTWLGLEYDEGPFYQTERFDRYRAVIQQLLDEDKAYHCYCSKERLNSLRVEQLKNKQKPRYDGHCRDRRDSPSGSVAPVVRFKNPPDGNVVVNDLIKGRVVFSNTELDDLIIARSDGSPTYNFTVVVDDMDMEITDVIRGDDHLNNTPRQINILNALGAATPAYAHVPMILGADGQRLSKRHGAVSTMQFREEGFLAEALLNYLVRLGWSHGDQEVFSIDEMIKLFDINNVQRSAASFDREKLLWLSQHYIKTSDRAHIAHHLSRHLGQLDVDPTTGPALVDVVDALRERAKTLVEMAQTSAVYYRGFKGYDEKDASKFLKPEILGALTDLQERLALVSDWTAEAIHQVIQETADAHGLKLGKIAQPLRVAVVGRAVSPPIDVTLTLVGQERTLEALDKAQIYIRQREGGPT
ncbi:MAG: glutamate--tRNA ligase [Gammaproteobacteria bacterium]|nr:glutamate--tRNA ligase [Gammaproteobacteria bacterium]